MRITPPWEHTILEAQTPTSAEWHTWLASLTAALSPATAVGEGHGEAECGTPHAITSGLGAVSTALARRIAAELLPDMMRMLLPPSTSITCARSGRG